MSYDGTKAAEETNHARTRLIESFCHQVVRTAK